MSEKNLSSCEAEIMKLIWSRDEDMALQEVIDELRNVTGKDYARTTVTTFLQRLAEKGFIKNYRNGRASYVHALISEEEYKGKTLKNFGDLWFHGLTSNMLSALCSVNKPSKEELEKMRKLIDELDD